MYYYFVTSVKSYIALQKKSIRRLQTGCKTVENLNSETPFHFYQILIADPRVSDVTGFYNLNTGRQKSV